MTDATVFVDTRLWKIKHPRKRFQSFRQSYVLSLVFTSDASIMLRFHTAQANASISARKKKKFGSLCLCNLVPRDPFCHALEKSGPPARSNDIPVLNGFVNTKDWNQNQSDLSDLTLSMRSVTGSRCIAEFRSGTWPEVAIPVANQKDCGLWERDWCLRLCLRYACVTSENLVKTRLYRQIGSKSTNHSH